MNLVIKFPTRQRPQKFVQTFLKYQHMVSGLHSVGFVVTLDEDDASMNNDKMRGFLNKFTNVRYFYGNSRNKIEAVNKDLEHLGNFDVLLLASDDMIPIEPGYDDIIYHEMIKHHPTMDGVIHFSDGRVGPLLNTLCIMGRKYFERFRYIYHPSYKSVYADNEFTDVSRILNKVAYKDICIIRHTWLDQAGVDPLYMRNESLEFYTDDKAVYERRKALNFELTPGA